MSIKEEGNYEGVIEVVDCIKGRFDNNPDVIEVRIKFNVKEVGSDYAYLSLDSYNYGKGDKSHLTRQQISLEALRDLGTDDLSQIGSLVGKPISIYSVKNDKYINHYVSKGVKGTVISTAQVMQELFGTAPMQAQAPAPTGFAPQAQAPFNTDDF